MCPKWRRRNWNTGTSGGLLRADIVKVWSGGGMMAASWNIARQL
jgi:hypothetical protein